jgi:hypothetical protein
MPAIAVNMMMSTGRYLHTARKFNIDLGQVK